jgi:pyruvate carboxylase
MLQKVLVANRGEIAIRAFRAAYELGIRTVAVYTPDDRSSLHRQKADEAYEIGEAGHPVRAYLDVDTLVETALRVEADAIYPGYGFLSESADLARACEEAGLIFVGPPSQALELTGNKLRARRAAEQAGIPVLQASESVADPDDASDLAEKIGYPVFVKAAGGGGGRGLRLVERREDLKGAIETAVREAEAAFGDPTVFLEQALIGARHIEVQVLADAAGEVVHLFERDCSVQRRHQKVLEIAPAPNLGLRRRERLWEDAVRFGRAVDYLGAGTVEFLVGGDAAGPRPHPGSHQAARRSVAVPRDHGRPCPGLQAGHGPYLGVPLSRRGGHPAGRRQHVRGHGDHTLFRLALGEGHRPRCGSAFRSRPCSPRFGRV